MAWKHLHWGELYPTEKYGLLWGRKLERWGSARNEKRVLDDQRTVEQLQSNDSTHWIALGRYMQDVGPLHLVHTGRLENQHLGTPDLT